MRAIEAVQKHGALSAERWVQIGFAFAAAIIIAVGAALYASMIASDDASRWVKHSHEVLETIYSIGEDVTRAESAQRGYLISGGGAQLGEYQQVPPQIDEHVTHLQALTADNPIQRQRSSRLAEIVSERLAILGETARIRRMDGFEAARGRIIRGDIANSRSEFFDMAAQMEQEELRLLSEREAADQALFRINLSILLIAISAALIVLIPAYVGFAMQSRARKQALTDLMSAKAAAERASEAKDRFLATMSHELRTPLNAVIGFTGTLLMKLPGPLNAEQEKQLRTVQASGKHLLALIDDLLDLAKIEAGKIELKLEPAVCQEVLEEAAAALRSRAESKGLELLVALPDAKLLVQTDRRALSQIVLNLLNNAIKYTERGSVRVVLVRREADAKAVIEISVQDSGVGIRLEDQARLFAAFSQVNTATRRQDGTGLGLHLSQKLAELLGGTIGFRSEYGKGSTFTLQLPQG